MVGILSGYSRRNCSPLGGEPPGGEPSGTEGHPPGWAARWHALPPAQRWQRQDWLMAVTPDLGCRWLLVRNPGHLCRPLPPIAIGHHRTFFTHLCFCNRRSVAQKQRFWGENKHIDGLQQTINGMAKLQWALTGVKPPVAVGFFRPFTFAAVFLNSTVPICGIAHRGQELIKYHNSKGHHGQGNQKWQHKIILKSEIPPLGFMLNLAHF